MNLTTTPTNKLIHLRDELIRKGRFNEATILDNEIWLEECAAFAIFTGVNVNLNDHGDEENGDG